MDRGILAVNPAVCAYSFAALHRRLFVSLAVLAVAWLGSSCNHRESREGGAKKGGEAKEVRLGYFANLTHAQAVLGVASGDFQNAIAPAKLTTRIFNAGPSLIEALLAGEIDIGYVGPGPALIGQARTHGQGLRVIAGATNNGTVIVVRDGSGIRTMADLRDRKIATPQRGNTQDIAARHYLKDVLHQSDLDNVIPISNAEQAGMLSRAQVDAVWAAEPWGSFLVAQAGARIIGEEKDLWPGKKFTLAVVITTPDFLREHPDVVERFLRAHVNWTRRLQQDPRRYLPQLASALFELTGKKFPGGVVDSALARVQFSNEPLQETFDSLSDWSAELGFLPARTDLTGLFDTTILRKVEREQASTRPQADPEEGADASRHSVAR